MESENITNWLYLLFWIVTGIVSRLSSKKKKKKVLPQSQDESAEDVFTETEEKDFWDTIRELETKQKEKPVHTNEPKEVQLTNEQPSQQPTTVSFTEKNAKQQTVHTPTTSVLSPEEPSSSLDLSLDSAADLRKAVIYSEILNRKF